VGTFEKVLVKVDLPDILIVLHSLLVHDNVVYDSLWGHRGYLDFDVFISESEMFHGLRREVPAHGSLMAHSASLGPFSAILIIQQEVTIFELYPFAHLS
jgi:hypothetical protein